MARVNVSMPDELHQRARQAGLNISRLAQQAVGRELERLAKIAALDNYLDEMEAELGPIGGAERAAAEEWVDRVLDPDERRHSA
jgi:hypothetical protein